jgi:hypothetical protein
MNIGTAGTDVDHLLITRLAVRLSEYARPPADAWLHARLALFERFCAPSVNAQTTAPDRWLLLFDQSTPKWFVDACCAVVTVPHEAVRLTAVWSPAEIARLVGERVDAPTLITSRLDSDDALARDYIKTVRARTGGQELAFVNLLNGAQWSKNGVSTYSHPSNAFISCVERVSAAGVRTVFLDGHDRLGRHGPVEQVQGTAPMWLQVVHDGNLLNGESGWPVRPDVVLDHFDVHVDRVPVGAVALATARAAAVGRLALRIASRPSRLRWIPRYVVARVTPGRRDGVR